ncbi:MAG: ClpP/crotonase-like domain-containing protein [Benjaminiella poitrasii]|nr:MAG: ClpP/crotonase-like domain-containing protein [Benjaminiella poitrasii]
MSKQEVLLSVENHVATLTLNRPKKGNALTATMNELLINYLKQIENDPEVRIVVLTGAGKFFCTGMDLSMAASSSSSEEDVKNSFAKGLEVFETLYRFPKPVIARINGPCLGGGVGLVFTTDIRVAYQDAYFALTEVKRGIIPAIISQYIVPELGSQRAREYMLTGRKVSMKEAANSLSCVASSIEQLDEQVAAYSTILLESAPGAMSNIKRLVDMVRSGGDPTNHGKRIHEGVQKAYLEMMQSEEAAYGIMAFVSKQKADWSSFVKDKNSKL